MLTTCRLQKLLSHPQWQQFDISDDDYDDDDINEVASFQGPSSSAASLPARMVIDLDSPIKMRSEKATEIEDMDTQWSPWQDHETMSSIDFYHIKIDINENF